MITKEGEGHLNDGIDQERNAILIKRKYPSLDSLKLDVVDFKREKPPQISGVSQPLTKKQLMLQIRVSSSSNQYKETISVNYLRITRIILDILRLGYRLLSMEQINGRFTIDDPDNDQQVQQLCKAMNSVLEEIQTRKDILIYPELSELFGLVHENQENSQSGVSSNNTYNKSQSQQLLPTCTLTRKGISEEDLDISSSVYVEEIDVLFVALQNLTSLSRLGRIWSFIESQILGGVMAFKLEQKGDKGVVLNKKILLNGIGQIIEQQKSQDQMNSQSEDSDRDGNSSLRQQQQGSLNNMDSYNNQQQPQQGDDNQYVAESSEQLFEGQQQQQPSNEEHKNDNDNNNNIQPSSSVNSSCKAIQDNSKKPQSCQFTLLSARYFEHRILSIGYISDKNCLLMASHDGYLYYTPNSTTDLIPKQPTSILIHNEEILLVLPFGNRYALLLMPTAIKIFDINTQSIVSGGSLKKRLAGMILTTATIDYANMKVFLGTNKGSVLVFSLDFPKLEFKSTAKFESELQISSIIRLPQYLFITQGSACTVQKIKTLEPELVLFRNAQFDLGKYAASSNNQVNNSSNSATDLCSPLYLEKHSIFIAGTKQGMLLFWSAKDGSVLSAIQATSDEKPIISLAFIEEVQQLVVTHAQGIQVHKQKSIFFAWSFIFLLNICMYYCSNDPVILTVYQVVQLGTEAEVIEHRISTLLI